MLVKDIKDPNEWKATPRLQRLSIDTHKEELEGSNTYLQLDVITCELNAKSPPDFFAVIYKLTLKLMWKFEEPRLARQTNRNIEKKHRTHFPNVKLTRRNGPQHRVN